MYFLLGRAEQGRPQLRRHGEHPTGLFAPQYYMVGLLAFGAMVAVMSGGARIAAERTIGWNRQLRLTPLSAARLPAHQGARPATSWPCVEHRRCSTSPGISLGVRLPARPVARDDRADPGRADPVRRAGHRARAPAQRRFGRAGARRRRVAVRVPRRHLVPDHRQRRASCTSASCCRPTGWSRPATSASAAADPWGSRAGS